MKYHAEDQTMRRCMDSNFFKKFQEWTKWNFVPFGQYNEGAVKMRFTEILDLKALILPKVNYEDCKSYFYSCRMFCFNNIELIETFTKDYGEEG